MTRLFQMIIKLRCVIDDHSFDCELITHKNTKNFKDLNVLPKFL